MPHKLLLADDSVTIQRVIELTFADEDVQVLAVGDGKQAIDRIQSDRPDIVLADVGMPERDGYEVAAYVKGNPQLSHIPVLLLTGAFEPIDETRARAVGCDGVLVKPFEPQMVISRVKDLLAGRRPTGLWSATQGAQTPVRPSQPAAEVERSAPPAAQAQGQPGASGDSLEEYFDRLDAAFATIGGESGPQPTGAAHAGASPHPESAARIPEPTRAPVDEIASWDPDLAGDPGRPAVFPPPSPPAQPQVSRPPEPARASPPAQYAPPPADPHAPVTAPATPAPPPSLAEAFAALLAAEQGRPIAPSAAAAVTDDVMDEIVRRVLDRMTDQTVRRTVLEVAERLVRDEIDRIKAGT
jgi:CheY-like chemotaxis protein